MRRYTVNLISKSKGWPVYMAADVDPNVLTDKVESWMEQFQQCFQTNVFLLVAVEGIPNAGSIIAVEPDGDDGDHLFQTLINSKVRPMPSNYAQCKLVELDDDGLIEIKEGEAATYPPESSVRWALEYAIGDINSIYPEEENQS